MNEQAIEHVAKIEARRGGPGGNEVMRRLVDDPKYFIESLLYVIDKDTNQKVPFVMRPAQADYFDKRTPLDMIVKSRKEGFSSVIIAEKLHACAMRQNTKAVIVSHTEEAAENLFKRLRYMLKHAAAPIKIRKDKAGQLDFPDTDSSIWIGTARGRTFGRGDDLTDGLLSEAAFYESMEVVTGVQEALMPGNSRLVIESTANGAGTPFHQAWVRAINKESDWAPHFYSWFWDPSNVLRDRAEPFELSPEERSLMEAYGLSWPQMAWRRWKLRTMTNPELFPQEYPASWSEAFLSSGAMVFDWRAVQAQETAAAKPLWVGTAADRGERTEIVPDPRGKLKIFVPPVENRRYLLVADAADGVPGGAYSVVDVMDMKTREQVAQYRGHIAPNDFGEMLYWIGRYFNWGLIAVENNYPGNAVLVKLRAMGYKMLYDEPGESGDELGWKTTSVSRAQFISDGRESLREAGIKINSEVTLNEMRTFVLNEKGRMQAQPGCFQDTVITICKAASILRNLKMDPELAPPKLREIMKIKRARFGGPKRESRARATVY